MSTVASQLLVTSSALIEDLYGVVTRKPVSSGKLVLYSRMSVAAIATVAALLAWERNDTILALVAFAWAGFGASFGPTVLLSLYWKRLTTVGAFAGMVTGAVVVMVWGNLSGGVFELYEILPGFVANLAVAIGVSLTRQPAPEVAEEFDRAVALASHRG